MGEAGISSSIRRSLRSHGGPISKRPSSVRFSNFSHRPEARTDNFLAAFRATADKLRLSLPLQLIQRIVTEPYMTLAERVQIQFDSGRCAEGSDEDDSASVTSDSSGKTFRTASTIEFGYLKNQCAVFRLDTTGGS